MQSFITCSLPDGRFMEIPFKKIKLEDRELIEKYLEQKTYRSCELVFANVYLWSSKYPVDYAIVEDTLIFRSLAECDGMYSQSYGCYDTMVSGAKSGNAFTSGAGTGV